MLAETKEGKLDGVMQAKGSEVFFLKSRTTFRNGSARDIPDLLNYKKEEGATAQSDFKDCLNKSNFNLPVELISWAGLPSGAYNVAVLVYNPEVEGKK